MSNCSEIVARMLSKLGGGRAGSVFVEAPGKELLERLEDDGVRAGAAGGGGSGSMSMASWLP